MKPSEILKAVKAAQIPAAHIDHHASDLYLKVTPETTRIIKKYKYQKQITTFKSNIDNTLWYDIPFCYTPFWEEKNK